MLTESEDYSTDEIGRKRRAEGGEVTGFDRSKRTARIPTKTSSKDDDKLDQILSMMRDMKADQKENRNDTRDKQKQIRLMAEEEKKMGKDVKIGYNKHTIDGIIWRWNSTKERIKGQPNRRENEERMSKEQQEKLKEELFIGTWNVGVNKPKRIIRKHGRRIRTEYEEQEQYEGILNNCLEELEEEREIETQWDKKREYKNKIIADIEEKYKNKEIRNFYQGIKMIKSNNYGKTPYVTKKDGSWAGGQEEILERLTEYFEELLNVETQTREYNEQEHTDPRGDAVDIIDNMDPPTLRDIWSIIKSLKNNRIPGEDEITAELIKRGREKLEREIYKLVPNIWEKELCRRTGSVRVGEEIAEIDIWRGKRWRTNQNVKELYVAPDIIGLVKSQRVRWFGHKMKMMEERLPKKKRQYLKWEEKEEEVDLE
ncbi:hypothetical protein ILUMI_04870 [Ignelater luminosus]|uniref:Uncharacterized protein n=1 Tax=Ignelater luminosus TaxID=2038154 RepID=A0A8K0D8U0_IGNLU|nr:hypothetical protein ILUMI_04870 [Ignelater luminosus]